MSPREWNRCGRLLAALNIAPLVAVPWVVWCLWVVSSIDEASVLSWVGAFAFVWWGTAWAWRILASVAGFSVDKPRRTG